MPRTRMVPLEAKFWSKVDVRSGLDCWQWRASQLSDTGYGQFGVERNGGWTMAPAHRVAYELIIGPIPEGLVIDHLCRNRLCVNPYHLEPVTNAENLRRGNGWSGINARKAFCVHGHEFTPENTYVGAKGRSCRACNRAKEQRRRDRLKAEASAA